MTILVTGAAGFIGSNFIHFMMDKSDGKVVNLDKLTYAGNLDNLAALNGNSRYVFIKGDIGDKKQVSQIFDKYQPTHIINFAAETHVDRSIHDPSAFIDSNIVGVANLLDVALAHYKTLAEPVKSKFRFLHISTDEVYGSLGEDDPPFLEDNRYEPNSPYAASKASADHLVRAYHRTYGLPTLTTNCSNNYGPYQYPEKLIPLMILNAIQGKELPIYGDGGNIRDWLYVTDHCSGIKAVLDQGRTGETYNIGGWNEKNNLEVVNAICAILDEFMPRAEGNYSELIKFVTDRPGHDRRYAIDASRIKNELGWTPKESFETGIRKTVGWYLENMSWIEAVTKTDYKSWIKENYIKRGKQ